MNATHGCTGLRRTPPAHVRHPHSHRRRGSIARAATLASALALLLAALHGCTAATPGPSARLAVRAQDPDGEPVADVQLWASGRPLGRTGPDGRAEAQLTHSTTLTALCPPTHETRTPERRITLAQPRHAAGETFELTIDCAPLRQHAALVVRATGAPPGLPIRARGQVVGHTDAEGVAHVLLEARPGATLRVSLDTAAVPALRPRDPMQTFRLGQGDQILLFEQAFERRRARARRAPPKPPPTPATPYRIH